jgi:aryl-alcohol dehydrogenase-like predicted oxidoreductase
MTSIDRFAIGLAALGRPAYINVGRVAALPADRSVAALRAATWAVLDAAYAAGVRRVDVARSYGRAEEFLAGWLAERGHADVTVSSKWGYAYVGDWRLDAEVHEVKEHSLARFRTQLAETRALLGDRLALYQVHSLTVDSPLFADRALLTELAQLADSGVRVGFSTSGPNQADAVRRALALDVDGQQVFTAVQSTWNVLETSVGSALAQAHRNGVLVMLKEVLANGILAVTPPAEVAKIAERFHTGPDAVALAAATANEWADVVLLGPASVEHLYANLVADQVRLNSHDLSELEKLAQLPQRYWANRSALGWV